MALGLLIIRLVIGFNHCGTWYTEIIWMVRWVWT